MTSSPDPLRIQVLRGAAASGASAARLDVELRSSRFQNEGAFDTRLADPTLQRAFEAMADEVRTAARAEGYASGWAAGHLAAAEAVRASAVEAQREREAAAQAAQATVTAALRALAAAATNLEQRAVTPAENLRDAVLEGAMELAEALVGHELSISATPGLDAVRRALALAPAGVAVTARLNPLDLPGARDALAALPSDELGREIRLVADASVEQAGCIVECDAARIDAQLSTALARVRGVLNS